MENDTLAENLSRSVIVSALIVALVIVIVYVPALGCGFVHFDDLDYVVNNQAIRALDLRLIKTAFTERYLGYVIPLTEISYALDYRLWGLNPVGYHLTNMVLHALNGAMVVLLAHRLATAAGLAKLLSAGRGYGFLLLAGLLYGIHPLRVESVAWVSGRKDVLFGLFALGSLYCYLGYGIMRRQGRVTAAARRSYLASLVFFTLSLLAKPVSVVLPLLLLVLDWYPLSRWQRRGLVALVGEKLPFIGVAVLMAIVTVVSASNAELLYAGDAMPLAVRLAISGNALFEYLRLFLYPVAIVPFYALPPQIPYEYLAKSAAVVILAAFCVYSARRRPWLPVTFAGFLLPLLPVLALIQQGPDASMAARYTYLPAVALSIGSAALLTVAGCRLMPLFGRFRLLVPAALAALLLFYAATTVRLIGVWKDTETFWGRIIDVDPIGRAYQERALFRAEIGKFNEAVDDFSRAIAITDSLNMPLNYNLYANRAEALRAAGRYREAERDFTIAIGLLPHKAYYHLRGLTLQALGRTAEAARDFRRAGPNPPHLDWF